MKRLGIFLALTAIVGSFIFVGWARAADLPVYLEKKTYLNGNETATFEPGQTVVVRVKINSNGNSLPNAKLNDYFASGSLSIENITDPGQCDAGSGPILAATFSTNESGVDGPFATWSGISFASGDGYLCYKYFLADNPADKNKLVQARTVLTEQFENLPEMVVASVDNYFIIRGFPYSESQVDPAQFSRSGSPFIEDELHGAQSTLRQVIDSSDTALTNTIGYIYKRGFGPQSRGGELYPLPVYMTNRDENIFYATDPFYLMYNPIYYLFGNIFSGGSYAGNKLGFNSGGSGITRQPYDRTQKLNAAASLYGYEFDQNSVLWWDRGSADKNKAMYDNIHDLISDPKPEMVCTLADSPAGRGSFQLSNIFLNSNNCANIAEQPTQNLWPDGRVWYLKTTSDITISSSSISGNGTVIIDYGGTEGKTVTIDTSIDSFRSGVMGLMVINGGKVNFAAGATGFKGVIFVPGKTSGTDPGGEISFEPNGQPLDIRGSLVADKITFNVRQKDSSTQYAARIYSDAKVLNTHLPGFRNIMAVVLGQ